MCSDTNLNQETINIDDETRPHMFQHMSLDQEPRPDLIIVNLSAIYGLVLYNKNHVAPNQAQITWPEVL